MLQLQNITLRIAGRVLLDNVTIQIPAGDRVGLVGRNGTGKTSLLRLIAGEIHPDEGKIVVPKNQRVGKVAQEVPIGHISVLATVLNADHERESLLAEAGRCTDPSRIAAVQNRLAEIEAHRAEAKASTILKGLGFDDAAQHQPIANFSGGWRMRAALASMLFLEPDLLLLDEPTNHLDIEATFWLQDFLRRYPGTLIVVSHDRDLLNIVPRSIVHLQGLKLTRYTGGYDDFDRVHQEKLALDDKLRRKQQAERQHMQAFVDRFRYKASKARQAQSRIKAIERLQPVSDLIIESTIKFDFPEPKTPPPPLITLDNVGAGYHEKIVLRQLNLRIDPDDRIALLGANGNGKSTFAKLIGGRLQPSSGEITRARGLRVGFFAQHQVEELESARSAVWHILARRPDYTEQDTRNYLGRFGLSGDLATKNVETLSGGEKTRLAISLCCLDAPHILILDEPTNHLDIASTEALATALNDYSGAVILISHDRHLIGITADRLWIVAKGRVLPFGGDLDDYRNSLVKGSCPTGDIKPLADQGSVSHLTPSARRQVLAPLRKQAKEVEAQIEHWHTEKAIVDRFLADPTTYKDDNIEPQDLSRKRQELEACIAEAEVRWLEVAEEIEKLEDLR